MIKLAPFKLIFRGEQVWINPEHVIWVQRRAGLTNQACIRLAHQGEAEDLVVEGSVDEVICKLTGKAPEPPVRPLRTFSHDSNAVQALEHVEQRMPT